MVGKPNSGKSSIIKQLTNAKPRVANFPFSTKFPIHGVIHTDSLYNEHEQEDEDGDFSENDNEDANYNKNEEEDDMASVNDADVNGGMESTKTDGDNSFVKNLMIVDIPGLISGSSSGRGLGHDFLRHIERCKIISYVVDSNVQDPLSDYLDVKKEIGTYDPSLLKKPEIILLNKIDLIDNKRIFELMNSFIRECDHDRIYFLSAKTRENVDFISLLFNQIYSEFILNNDWNTSNDQEDEECNIDKLDEFRNLSRRFKIEHEDGIFTIKSPYLERKVKMMRFDLPETLDRFRHILKVNKIRRKLVKLGLKPGDVLKIGDVSFTVQTDEFFI
ncbi:uncharacterized protein TOT_010001235 [Theileria orientalis strain Shintoku]|uniref:GTPase n=1 Tax=Theileria orientalis strain Shintoku TaxID=869250 RepID=J4C7C7_THEOR|nr:uncharacterized protein TOT_010001235 [Theileria orientalis strain Shintoku]BAM38808.1 uncharacterized protein TOT_010001235 [Theileria orientalis strain Shintoku]|eukprot:XP_009689109.1 uncharacterized protein TOT_010001235 [Theileria orientalis strain Shintoku]